MFEQYVLLIQFLFYKYTHVQEIRHKEVCNYDYCTSKRVKPSVIYVLPLRNLTSSSTVGSTRSLMRYGSLDELNRIRFALCYISMFNIFKINFVIWLLSAVSSFSLHWRSKGIIIFVPLFFLVSNGFRIKCR